jgi:hypothetical protein
MATQIMASFLITASSIQNRTTFRPETEGPVKKEHGSPDRRMPGHGSYVVTFKVPGLRKAIGGLLTAVFCLDNGRAYIDSFTNEVALNKSKSMP